MISKAISLLTFQLNDYLKLRFRLTEDIAFVSPPVKDTSNSFPANRISISVVSLEKENMGGIPHSQQMVADNLARKSAVAWQVNVYLLVAAIFIEKQYSESIQLLSGALSFLQKSSYYPLSDGKAFTTELVNLSFHELSNLWGICGGSYYPSVVCKARGIEVDENDIIGFSGLVKQQGINSDAKQ